jgi:putative hydrolase of the HAD superfamily
MIKNIVFDIGNVLAEFRWKKMLAELGFEGEIFEAVANATVRSPLWAEFDRSAVSDEEIIRACVANAPEYKKEILSVFENIHLICETYTYAKEWVIDLRARGYRVYLLSNFGRTSFAKATPQLDFLPYVDGRVISYEVGEVKPDREIFSALEEKYGIAPEESIFFDDMKENVEAAVRYGYHGVVFTSREDAEEQIKTIIKETMC